MTGLAIASAAFVDREWIAAAEVGGLTWNSQGRAGRQYSEITFVPASLSQALEALVSGPGQ